MLEKFGRKVRHSIADEEDDFETARGGLAPPRRHYQHNRSMQLIEEVIDD